MLYDGEDDEVLKIAQNIVLKLQKPYRMGKAGDLDKKSKDFFLKMQQNYKNLLDFATNNYSDHSKVIICDRDWMITTSFNWTSFKGDINREKRGERGSYINDKNEINAIVREYTVSELKN